MAHSKSAKKRIRVAERNRLRNKVIKSKYKTSLKKVEDIIIKGDLSEATKALSLAQKAVDKAAGKGVIHKNKAARLKSKISIKMNGMEKAS